MQLHIDSDEDLAAQISVDTANVRKLRALMLSVHANRSTDDGKYISGRLNIEHVLFVNLAFLKYALNKNFV